MENVKAFIEKVFPGKTEEEISALEEKYGDIKLAAIKESSELEKLNTKGYRVCDNTGCYTITPFGTWLSSDGPYYNLRDDVLHICRSCFEQDNVYATPCTIYYKGRKYAARIGELAIYAQEELEHIPLAWLLYLARRTTYVRIDGWRGYATFKKNGKLQRVIDSAIAIDGATFGNDDDEKMLCLQELLDKNIWFEPMIVAFPPTSNVCVTGVEVWVPPKSVKQFERFLKRQNPSVRPPGAL